MTSGTLKTYLKKTKGVIKPKVLKNWCKQILNGLLYLHTRNPIVIHRDLKAENIFINGNNGQAKIGDLGLAAFKSREHMSSVLGTPEFMAPELYDEKYDEKIDIYSFGMVVLEIVTKEYPYTECQNQAQIYKRVTAGTKPLALNKIADSQTRDFIELCILFDKNLRPTAQQLLSHAFLVDETVTNASTESSVASHSPHHSPAIRPTESQQTIEGAIFSLSGSRIDSINDLPSPMIPVQLSSSTTVSSGKSSISPASSILNEQLAFTTPLKEKTAIVDTDSHTFHITPRSEHASNPSQNVYIDVSSYKSASEILVKMIYVSPDKSLAQDIKFPFNLNEDTATDVISEMVNEKLIHADDEALCRRKLEELVRRVFINNGKKNSAGSLTDLQVTSGSQVSLNSDTLVAKPETEQYWITPSEQEVFFTNCSVN